MRDKVNLPGPVPVDSILSAVQGGMLDKGNVSEESSRRMKSAIIVLAGVPYLVYIVWCLFLISVLPDASGRFDPLVMPGVLSAAAGMVVLVILSFIAFRLLFRKGIDAKKRIGGTLRVLIFLAPGILISFAVPAMITKEPPLWMDILDPSDESGFVAPVSVTFSVESAVQTLQKRGFRASGFSWDFDGDGKENDSTVVPQATAVFDRQGAYIVGVLIKLDDGGSRLVRRQIIIPQEVFFYFPLKPGVDEPVRFSVASLVGKTDVIREVQWDFDDDSVVDHSSNLPDAVHTFLRTGKVTVSVTLNFESQTQRKYSREIEIIEPQPPPFPVVMKSEPENLIGTVPFGTIFRVESEVELGDVIWDFGDGSGKKRGERVGHTFQKNGTYQVSARVHAKDGQIADISKAVFVADKLLLSDLEFDGKPKVRNGEMTAEVPVTVNLIPRTSVPLVEFRWEAPGATSVGSLESELKAIYRRPGHYDITLIAEDPEGKVLRYTLSLTVEQPASEVKIHMSPEGGTAPLLVKFDASETVISDGEISGFEWIFGDGGEGDSGPQQRGALVEHLFEKPGTFKIQLTAYTTGGNSYKAERTIVVRAPVLDACAFPSRNSGKAPLGVSFDMSCTTGIPAMIEWNFGDGARSDERDPVHVFDKPGEYTVQLSLEDSLGSKSEKVILIKVE